MKHETGTVCRSYSGRVNANFSLLAGCSCLRASERVRRWKERLHSIVLVALISAGCLLSSTSYGGPAGGDVAAGSANIVQTTPKRTDIIQQSNRAVINWQRFSINVDEHVNFQQPTSKSATLNRVKGPEVSNILGRLTANGNVFLINPNGILFGTTAKIDVAGLLASTTNIKNDKFMAGRYEFDQVMDRGGRIVNYGEISVAEGGLVALVAPGVENHGVIKARLGRVALASGNRFTLDLYGDQLVSLAVDDSVVELLTDVEGKPAKALVEQSGEIQADGGEVLLTASAAKTVVDNVINMSGVIRARSVVEQNGEIVLLGGDEGGVRVAGQLDASGRDQGQTGGTVQVLGDKVELAVAARIDVSGDAGGGTALVGGDFKGQGEVPTATQTTVASSARIVADALSEGDGGKVIVWADERTRYDGKISAAGGAASGDGGLVEVSGKKQLIFRGEVVAGAPNGKAGTLLLDPENITIGATGSDTLGGDPSTIQASTVNTTLNQGTSVTLSADNDIRVDETIDGRLVSGGTAGGALTLRAGDDIAVNASILTDDGAISIVAGDAQASPTVAKDGTGGIVMAPQTLLYADSKPISLSAEGSIDAQDVLTTGAITVTSANGSVVFHKNLFGLADVSGDAQGIGSLSVEMDGGGISLGGVLANNGPVRLTASGNVTNSDAVVSPADGAVTVTAGGNADLGRVDAGRGGVTVTADGDIAVTDVMTSVGAIELIADQSLAVEGAIAIGEQAGDAAGNGVSLEAGVDVTIDADVSTEGGPILATARAGSISMSEETVLFAGDGNIGLLSDGDLVVENLVTSGNVGMTSTHGSVFLNQDLGGLDSYALGNLAITSEQGAVSLRGLRTNGAIEVSGLRNVDVNGPISAGGTVELSSLGSAAAGAVINLNHNIFTQGETITFTGEVVLDPSSAELIVEESPELGLLCGEDCPVSDFLCGPSQCSVDLCPECEVTTDPNILWHFDTEEDEVLVLDSLDEFFRYVKNDFKDPNGNPLVIGLNSAEYGTEEWVQRASALERFFRDQNGNHTIGMDDTLKDGIQEADQRAAALLDLFKSRQVTLSTGEGGGDITFNNAVSRESSQALENFTLAFDDAENRRPEFDGVVFPTFTHTKLVVSAGEGTVTFSGNVGEQRHLELANSFDQMFDGPNFRLYDGFPVEGGRTNLPVIGSFLLSNKT